MLRLLSVIIIPCLTAGSLVAASGSASPTPNEQAQGTQARGEKEVYVVPIREPIMPPLVYLVRRGVKEAMKAEADLLVLDMKTNGGRVDVTEKVIEIIDRFPGKTVTLVNDKAYSAGAFISVATKAIYMTPQAVIGAAAPVMGGPGGAKEVPDTMERKMVSAISALVRAHAEKNGHNVEVVQAMIDQNNVLKMDGQVLCEKGELLTLTASEARAEYGNPPKPLLSAGIVSSVTELLAQEGYQGADVTRIEPTGAERLASWINGVRPILLLIGILGLYLEFKAPGFGIPGILGLISFAIYFFGNYVAGLSGMEWMALFLVGVFLVVLELFIFPGLIIPGAVGAILILVALVMAMVDLYPNSPELPPMADLRVPMRDLGIAFGSAFLMAILLARLLPHTSVYQVLVSSSVSGEVSPEADAKKSSLVGQEGTTISVLAPGGKARFGDDVMDVISQGEMLEKGRRVRVVGYSGYSAVVEPVDERASG